MTTNETVDVEALAKVLGEATRTAQHLSEGSREHGEHLAQAVIDAGYSKGGTATPDPSEFIDVVFDGPPSHESGRFVEVENPNGYSIRVGQWIDRGDGFWALRIPRATPDPAGVSEFRFTDDEWHEYQRLPEQGYSHRQWLEMRVNARLPHLSGPAVTDAEPWPDCPDHSEMQHRDRKGPWCYVCGWNRGRPAIPATMVTARTPSATEGE